MATPSKNSAREGTRMSSTDSSTPRDGGNAGSATASETDSVGRGNLRFWNELSRTDPRYTKPFKRVGYSGTQIDPTWRIRRMTETFGPVGIGWGWKQLEWTVQEGMIFICCSVWYRDPDSGEIGETGPQWGGSEIVRTRRDGSQDRSDECFKMSITDAVGKCLVSIGVAADVHLGDYDSSKYREESEAYYQAKDNPHVQPAAIAALEEEVKAALTEADDVKTVEDLYREKAKDRVADITKVDRAAASRIVAHFTKKKAELMAGDEKPLAAPQTEPAQPQGGAAPPPPKRQPAAAQRGNPPPPAPPGHGIGQHTADAVHRLAQAGPLKTYPLLTEDGEQIAEIDDAFAWCKAVFEILDPRKGDHRPAEPFMAMNLPVALNIKDYNRQTVQVGNPPQERDFVDHLMARMRMVVEPSMKKFGARYAALMKNVPQQSLDLMWQKPTGVGTAAGTGTGTGAAA